VISARLGPMLSIAAGRVGRAQVECSCDHGSISIVRSLEPDSCPTCCRTVWAHLLQLLLIPVQFSCTVPLVIKSKRAIFVVDCLGSGPHGRQPQYAIGIRSLVVFSINIPAG
jgi:hypothetical protein